jgi:hypothetical protein
MKKKLGPQMSETPGTVLTSSRLHVCGGRPDIRDGMAPWLPRTIHDGSCLKESVSRAE